MPKVVLIDWGTHPSLGLKTLQIELAREQIESKIIQLPFSLANQLQLDIYNTRSEAIKILERAGAFLNAQPEVRNAKYIGLPLIEHMGQRKGILPLARVIKMMCPNATLIGGGPAISSNPKGIYSNAKLDYAIRGEAEEALPKLIQALEEKNQRAIETVPGIVYRKKGRIIVAPQARINPDRMRNSNLVTVNYSKRTVGTYTERGCPQACIFCTVPRKGKPITLSDEQIISGLEELAKTPAIKFVSFMDDQFFSNRERSMRLLNKIIERGLHKRFRFIALATIDSFLKNGKVDMELITKLQKARFLKLNIGTESLNDAMLKEIKSGRYTGIQAIQVNNALTRAGIHVNNFQLAGGIHTKPIDFLEAYYRSMAREYRNITQSRLPPARRPKKLGRETHEEMGMIQASKGTPIYLQALHEGALVNSLGRTAGEIKARSSQSRIVVPKDPTLKQLFVNQIKTKKFHFDGEDIESIVLLGKALSQTNPYAAKLTRRLLIIHGAMQSTVVQANHAGETIWLRRLEEEALRTQKPAEQRVQELRKEKKEAQRQGREVDKLMIQYVRKRKDVEELTGLVRLRAIQKLRKKYGVGMTPYTQTYAKHRYKLP
jgi:hypothetical protein